MESNRDNGRPRKCSTPHGMTACPMGESTFRVIPWLKDTERSYKWRVVNQHARFSVNTDPHCAYIHVLFAYSLCNNSNQLFIHIYYV